MAAIPVIIDCDPGQDDAVALLTALGSPELEILGVTVVHGNVPLPRAAANARALVEFARRAEISVYAGGDRPLQRAARHAVHIHGATGLRGWDLGPPAGELAACHAVEFLVETLRTRDDVTLCALGPLTNIAAAFTWAPEIASRVRRLVLMGGGAGVGNVTPAAEFNIFADPEAAAIVFGAGVPLTMLGLHLTWQALASPERLQGWRTRGGRAGSAVAGMYDCPERFDIARYGAPGLPLHDPCVIAYVLLPELFEGPDCYVAIETSSPLTLGQTVVDRWGTLGRPANAHVPDRIDADGLFALVTERLARL